MPFTVKAVKDPGYILLEHYGDITVAETNEGRTAVIAQVMEHGIFNILVDVHRVTNKLSTFDSFHVTQEHGKVRRPGMRGAILARPDQMDDAKFMENVAVNRGMNIRAFTDQEEALKWFQS